MKIPFEKISFYIFLLLLIFEIIFLGMVWNSKHEDISFKNETLKVLDGDWTYADSEGNISMIQLPAALGNDGIIRISHVLPGYIQSDWVLTTLSTHRSFHVYLDQKLIYSNGDEDNLPINLTPGSIWNIIHLPSEAAGKVITLEILPERTYTDGLVSEIYIGSKAAFLLHIIEEKGFNLFLSSVILLIGISLIIVYFSMIRFLKQNKSILYLGMFSFLVALWMLMESNMMQFFMDNRYLISTAKYLALITLPVPILFYIALIDNYRYKKQVLALNGIFIANAFVMLSLQLLNICSFHDGLLFLHILMVTIFSIIFVMLCIEVMKYRNKNFRSFIISFGVLFLCSIIEIVSYNLSLKINTGSFLQVGVLVFLTVLSLDSLGKAREIVQLSENAKQYEYLATRDYMTKCKNRNAYSTELEQLSLEQKTAIILADINNTKYINDTYGHHAGDFVIVKCSQCLMSIFGNDEYCYRIGGDEFVCIEYNQSEKSVKDKIDTFFRRCEEINSDCPYPFEVSVGYAFYDKQLDKNIYDTVERADKEMYRSKNGMKFSSI